MEAVRQGGSLSGHEGTPVAARQGAARDMVQQRFVFPGERIDAILYGYRHSAALPEFEVDAQGGMVEPAGTCIGQAALNRYRGEEHPRIVEDGFPVLEEKESILQEGNTVYIGFVGFRQRLSVIGSQIDTACVEL